MLSVLVTYYYYLYSLKWTVLMEAASFGQVSEIGHMS